MRLLLIISGTFILGAVLLVVGGGYAVERIARAEADAALAAAEADNADPVKLAVELARMVHEDYVDGHVNTHLLVRLRPYLTSAVLPRFLRVQEGAIETIHPGGLCDSAVRQHRFLLDRAGIDAWQLNIVAPNEGGHSITLVRIDGEEFAVDPFFGVVATDGISILSPADAQARATRGHAHDELWRPIAPTGNAAYYADFADAVMSRQGQPLRIAIDVKLEKGEVVTLGDGNSGVEDVNRSTMARGWGSQWSYVGSRYDASWERAITVWQPTRITFALKEEPDRRFITSDRAPRITGNRFVYELSAGETLHLRDGLARRDWLRLRRHQDVDYIVIEAIGDG